MEKRPDAKDIPIESSSSVDVVDGSDGTYNDSEGNTIYPDGSYTDATGQSFNADGTPYHFLECKQSSHNEGCPRRKNVPGHLQRSTPQY